MPQFLRPVSTVSAGGWTTQSGGTDLHTAIDEATASTADYIQSSASPSTPDICKVRLATGNDPVSSIGHIVRAEYQKSVAAGDVLDFTVRLMQGATQIAAWTYPDIANGYVDVAETLSGAQADAIAAAGGVYDPPLDLWFESVVGSTGITDPTDIANLLVWLNADDIAQADNTTVDTWSDGSGNGWNATATGTISPTVQTAEINGHKIVRFDGINDYMRIINFAAGGGTTLSLYAVVKIATPGAQMIVLQQFDPWYNQNGGWVLDVKTTGKGEVGHFGNVGLSSVDSTANVADGTAKLVRALYDMTKASGEVTVFVNGAASTGTYTNDSNNTGSFGTNTLGIGGTPGGGQVLAGDIAEIAIYTRNLTAPEITNLDDYFTTKYGL